MNRPGFSMCMQCAASSNILKMLPGMPLASPSTSAGVINISFSPSIIKGLASWTIFATGYARRRQKSWRGVTKVYSGRVTHTLFIVEYFYNFEKQTLVIQVFLTNFFLVFF